MGRLHAQGTLAVTYYDRQYGDDEFTGASDVSVSTSSNLTAFTTERVTSASMPPPTQFPTPRAAASSSATTPG